MEGNAGVARPAPERADYTAGYEVSTTVFHTNPQHLRKRVLGMVLMTMTMMIIITSPLLSHLGSATLPSLTAANGLAHCVCYYLCNSHCRRVQSLSHRYTLHPHRSPRASYTLHCVVLTPKRNLPLLVGATHPTGKKSSPCLRCL